MTLEKYALRGYTVIQKANKYALFKDMLIEYINHDIMDSCFECKMHSAV